MPIKLAQLKMSALVFFMPALPSEAQDFETWTQYLGGVDSSQYSALDEIDATNVAKLELVWDFPTGDGMFRFNPLIVHGVMYVIAAESAIVALDAATGKELWRRQHEGAISDRGISYWESADGEDARLLYINDGRLKALNARTGRPIASFGQNGGVDLRAGLDRDAAGIRPLQTSNPGRIFENLMIVSLPATYAYEASPGDIQAYDVRTGALEWVFHTIPKPGEVGSGTWPPEALSYTGGGHNWSELTIDLKRGIAFVPTGSPRYDFYGGNRHGRNLFTDSLLALDARTGKLLWHHQLVHHDLWDYDLPTAPKLLTIDHDGKRIDVVAQATKWGYLYVFDRDTGKPIWPIEERPVPASDVPGEEAWPTQPIPTAPPPFARLKVTVDDLNPYLPEAERDDLRKRWQTLRNEGLYTPPSLEGSIRLAAGASWGSTAVDPERGLLYVVSQERPTIVTLLPPRPGAPAPRSSNTEFVPYRSPMEFLFAENGLSALGPPWSQLTAYDLNSGTIAWQIPNGEVAGLAARGITGTGSQTPPGGPLLTAGGLLFIGTSSDRMLRAYRQSDGQILWEYALDNAMEGVPATYAIDGRQYLVVCAAARDGVFPPQLGAMPEPGPGHYLVFALPEH
jgi:quinoprotein glucose dehydrogenase